jgi:hypothetical protein
MCDVIGGANPSPGDAADDLAVEVIAAYLNPAEQVNELRAALVRLSAPDAPADESDLGAGRRSL